MLKFLAMMLMTVPVYATSIHPLATPTGVPSAYPARTACVATTFNADDSANGSCYSQTASASSGRGGHPTYTNLVYTASWDVDGNALVAGTYCGKYVVNYPFVQQWTYAPGFTATTCVLPTAGKTQILLYDPSLGFEHWFEYIATSADGTYMLITEGLEGLLYGL